MRNLSLSMYTISQQTTELQAVYKWNQVSTCTCNPVSKSAMHADKAKDQQVSSGSVNKSAYMLL